MSTQVEELQINVEELLYKQDVDVLVAVAEKLEYPDIDELKEKSRIRAINVVRRHIEELVENASSDEGKLSLLNNVRSELSAVDVDVAQQKQEVLKLQEAYDKLKLDQEKQLSEMMSKIDKMKSKTHGDSPKEVTVVSSSGTSNVSEENKVSGVVLTNQSLLRREFKVSGQIGDPGQTEKLTFVSLNHQIDSGLKRNYTEQEIVDAVIRSITPHTSLRSYVETLPDLTLPQLRKILRIHYQEKTASELYQQLTTMCQKPKENVQQFLLRVLDARNRVIFASKEADCNFNYNSQLVQTTFLKALETGIRDDHLTTSLRPILQKEGITDEELMRSINDLAAHKAERENKLGKECQSQHGYC